MKRDGRGFDHRTLEAIRLMAVERARGGERPSSVVASYGFNRTTIYRWLNAAAKPGVGLRALRARPATGRPRCRATIKMRTRDNQDEKAF
jgi:DNA invertase Pin-like site-specific DNA recombinase